MRPAFIPGPHGVRGAPPGAARGSALIVALWTLLILSVLVGSFAFDMRVEAGIASHYRKRVKADALAAAGVEWARYVLARSRTVIEGEDAEDPDVYLQALHLSRGVGVQHFTRELGDGRFTLDILSEESRRNVNLLTDDEWTEILDQANVPQERWDELIDCFRDWTDPNDDHRVNGAESDDPWYEARGYPCRNAPLDLVEELTLIKGFDEDVVYGGPGETPDDPPMLGIAHWLTTWGDGRVNVNTASREVLLSLVGIAEWDVDGIIQGRSGEDEQSGTEDDGYRNVDEVVGLTGIGEDVAEKLTVRDQPYMRVVSIGEVQGVRRGIWCVLRVEGDRTIPVFWREEELP